MDPMMIKNVLVASELVSRVSGIGFKLTLSMVAIIDYKIYCQLSPSSHDHLNSPKISLGTVGARKFFGNRKFINFMWA